MIQQLSDQFDVRFLVAVDRAGPNEILPSETVSLVFRNDGVKVYEVSGK